MRDLHARHGARRVRSDRAQGAADGRRCARGAVWKSVPLHRVHADLCVRARRMRQARSMLPLLDGYELVTPSSVQEVLADLAAHPGARPFAGGTDLMVVLEAGNLPRGRYISLEKCPELVGIRQTSDGVTIGARTTYSDIRASAVLSHDYPLLGMAAAQTGGIATQNRGTLGGNIANASPAADTPPALLVYDAELEMQSQKGTRRVPYTEFHTGYKQLNLGPSEIIAAIRLPARSPGWRPHDYYRKVGTR